MMRKAIIGLLSLLALAWAAWQYSSIRVNQSFGQITQCVASTG